MAAIVTTAEYYIIALRWWWKIRSFHQWRCPVCRCRTDPCPCSLVLSFILLVCHHFILIPASVKFSWPDALSLPMWRGASAFPSDLQPLVQRTVNVDIKMEAGSSVPLSLSLALSCDCLTNDKLRQAEMASPLWTCHLRCVRDGHVALTACPSLRVLHNKYPCARWFNRGNGVQLWLHGLPYKSSTLSQFASPPLLSPFNSPQYHPHTGSNQPGAKCLGEAQLMGGWRGVSWGWGFSNCTWK